MTYPEPIVLAETTSTKHISGGTLPERSVCGTDQRVFIFPVSWAWPARQQLGVGSRKEPPLQFCCLSGVSGAHRQFYLSQVTALALHDVLSSYTEGISIKWPNDIYWKDKKICGTLIENDLTGIHISRSISGTGVNLNQERFLSDALIRYHYARLRATNITRGRYWNRLWKSDGVLSTSEREPDRVLETRYKEALYRKEGLHLFRDKDGDFRARIADIEPNGRLILEDENGQTRGYLFKEVEYIL